jgi:hypothetical protein
MAVKGKGLSSRVEILAIIGIPPLNAVSAIPDAASVIFDIAQIVRDRKWRGAARFERLNSSS